MKTRRRTEAGFSLMEMLFAMTLFSFVASGTAALAVASMRHTANNRASTSGQMLAQEELERVRGLEYADIVSGTRERVMHGQDYEIGTNVVDNSPATGMKHITVTVGWQGPMGYRSYAIETIFTSVR